MTRIINCNMYYVLHGTKMNCFAAFRFCFVCGIKCLEIFFFQSKDSCDTHPGFAYTAFFAPDFNCLV